jgi:hypothetical protein
MDVRVGHESGFFDGRGRHEAEQEQGKQSGNAVHEGILRGCRAVSKP